MSPGFDKSPGDISLLWGLLADLREIFVIFFVAISFGFEDNKR